MKGARTPPTTMAPSDSTPPSDASPSTDATRRQRSRHRRTVLRGVAGAAAVGVVGTAAARSPDGPATSPAGMEPAGTLQVDGLSEVVVDESGAVAYGALRTGYVTVDVSDPADPRVLAERRGILSDYENGPLDGVFEVAVSGDRLLVAGPNGGRGFSAFALVDVSDPSAPERVAANPTSYPIHNASIEGEVAYLTDSTRGVEAVVVVDVGDDDPERVARWDPTYAGYESGNCHDLYAQDDVLYVAYWDAGSFLLDVSDPASPALIARTQNVADDGAGSSTFGLPGNSHYVQPNADATLLAVGREAWDDPDSEAREGPGPVDVFDVADPTDPEHLTTLAPPEDPPSDRGHTAHNLGWRGDRLYTSWYRGGVRVYDLSTPSDPTLLGTFRDETASFWTAKPIAGGFVGSSFQDPTVEDRTDRYDGVGASLYVFEAPEGDGSPAPTTDPVGGYRYDQGPASAGTTARPTSAPAPTTDATGTDPGSPTADAPETVTPTASAASPQGATTDGTTATSDGGTPGFGPLAALLGGGLAVRRLWRRRSE